MTARPHHDNVLSTLNIAIEAVNLGKEISSITPVKAVFGSVSILLTMIRDSMNNNPDYVDLGLACADVCRAIDRGISGRRLNELSRSVHEAITQLVMTVAEIQEKVVKEDRKSVFSRLVHAKGDKEMMAGWRSDLNRVLHVFNTVLMINTHIMVSDTHKIGSDIHRTVTNREGPDGQHRSTQISVPPGELPPRPPQACFGRAEFIEKIVGLAKNFTSVALIGTGGIGKTFIALAVLHHRHIKQRFGDNRWFIDCNQFPASRTHFLRRLSAVIGAGVRNPENIAPLRPFLSSRELFVVLDNAESILDPRGMDTQEIYAMVGELGQFRNICLCITSRVSTIPPDCKMLDVPTLSMEAACNAFYCTHETGEQSSLVNNILQQLNFHPLSISLLAKVAYHNTWGYKQLSQEWNAQCTQVLLTGSNGGLEKVIKLLFTSLAFRKLGPNACDLLSVIAFFPQGINENNLDWLFPTIPRRKDIFDKFCALSLTYQGNGFIRMLAPLRDYFFPKDPRSSPLLYITKERYFNRLSVHIEPGKPGFKEAQWISTEDVNIEYLLDVFTSVDTNSVSVWHACACFMEHLYWYKPQHLMMGPKIEELPDDHPSKPECLFHLSQLFGLLGNPVESKWLLTCTLKLWREQDNDYCIAQTLVHLSNVSWRLGLHIEGVYQVEEALGIYRQLNNTLGQAQALQHLARLLHGDNQLDAAEEAALQAIALLPDEGEQSIACQCNHTLGSIYLSKGETEAAMTYFETAIKIASSFNWDDQLFWIHCSLAELFSKQGRLSNAYNHIEYAKLHAINDTYLLGHAMELQAGFSYHQNRFEEAKSEALCASTIFEDSGAVVDAERCREILQNIEGKIKGLATSSVIDPNSNGTEG